MLNYIKKIKKNIWIVTKPTEAVCSFRTQFCIERIMFGVSCMGQLCIFIPSCNSNYIFQADAEIHKDMLQNKLVYWLCT
jgi:hypothetical protein